MVYPNDISTLEQHKSPLACELGGGEGDDPVIEPGFDGEGDDIAALLACFQKHEDDGEGEDEEFDDYGWDEVSDEFISDADDDEDDENDEEEGFEQNPKKRPRVQVDDEEDGIVKKQRTDNGEENDE